MHEPGAAGGLLRSGSALPSLTPCIHYDPPTIEDLQKLLDTTVFISGTRKLSKMLKRDLRRRSAIEPELGYMKSDGLFGRNFLKGVLGDAQNVILCGAGHNMRKILAYLRALLRLLMGEPRKVLEAIIALLEHRGASQQAVPAA